MLQPEDLGPLSDAERQLFTLLTPEDHFLRQIVQIVDFESFRPVLATVYCPDDGRPPLDPAHVDVGNPGAALLSTPSESQVDQPSAF